MTPDNFLSRLFGNKPNELYILIHHMRTQTSHWFTDPVKAGRYALKKPKEVYVGVALSPDPRTLVGNNGESIAYIRCKANQTAGIVGLWADIDIKHDQAHKGKNYAPDLNTALGIVTGQGWDPTLIVHSGYGLHCWWLFKEPWIFESDEDRRRAAHLELRLLETLRLRGHTIDGTHDLARILRIPGTKNCKNDCEVDVVLLKATDQAYNPEDLDEVLTVAKELTAAESEPNKTIEVAISSDKIHEVLGSLVFNPNPAIDVDRLHDLFDAFDPRFTHTWRMERNDLKADSPSEYDHSLAHFAIMCGWSDQEILNLLIAFRNKHKTPLKFDNKQYYARTIVESRQNIEREDAEQGISTAAILQGTSYCSDDPVIVKDSIAKVLRLHRIVEFVKWDQEEPSYHLQFEPIAGRTVVSSFKTFDDWEKFRLFKSNIGKKSDVIMPDIKKKVWFEVTRMLSAIMETRAVSEESTVHTQTRNWTLDYLDEFPPVIVESGLKNKDPITFKGEIYIFTKSLIKWIVSEEYGVLSVPDMNKRLVQIGCKQSRIQPTVDGKQKNLLVIWVPQNIFRDDLFSP